MDDPKVRVTLSVRASAVAWWQGEAVKRGASSERAVMAAALEARAAQGMKDSKSST